MKRRLLFAFVIILLISLAIAQEDNPPSLTDFHQFYGKVNQLPAGGYILLAKMGGASFSASVANDGRFGYSPVFKVTGQNGQEIIFVLKTQNGNETILGTHQYQSGQVTLKDFTYGLQTQEEPETTTNETSTSTSTSRSNSRTNQTNGTSNTCTQEWSCGTWSNCQGGSQTRLCERIDDCDDQVFAGENITVISVSVPSPQQSCGVTGGPQLAQVCQPNLSRCSGKLLQKCSSDGFRWDITETCTGQCDSLTLSCRDLTSSTTTSSNKIPTWLYPVIGSLVLLGIVAGVALYLHNRKKYGPVKEYIIQSRKSGIPNEQIRARLVTRGWDSRKVNSLLK
ncbi:MAG: hypothetical protein Q8Q01_03770 [archaeon]|nr:hypothetical protein [archaeon]